MNHSLTDNLNKANYNPTTASLLVFGLLGGLAGLALLLPTFKLLSILIVALVGAVVIVAKPERSLWLVISYVLVDYVLRNSPIYFLAGVWDELAFIGITGLWIGKMAWEKRARFDITPLDWSIFIFLAVSVFLLFRKSPDMSIALEGWRAVAQYVFWFFVANNLISGKKQVSVITNLMILVATGIALHGVYQFIIGVPIPPEWVDKAETGIRTRVYSIIGSPNILGSLMVLTIPLTLSALINAQNWIRRILLFCALGAMGACLMFTFSRGAWLAAIGGIVFFGLLKDRRILILIIVAAFLTPIAVPSVYDRMSYMLSPEYIKSSQKGGRLVRWEQALDKVERSPMYGVGLGRFGGAVAKNNDIPGTFYIDNYYLKTLTEMGIVGLTAMLWLFINCVRLGLSVYRRVKDDRYLSTLSIGILAGVVGVLLHNAVENIFEVPMMQTYFWVLMGVLAAMGRIGHPEPDTLE